MSETPSHFVAVCPNCLISLKVRIGYSGSHVACKHCEHKFRAFAPDLSMTPSSEEYHAGPLGSAGSAGDRLDVVCPNCSACLRVPKELAGQHVRCNLCDNKFLVQKIEEVPAQLGHADSEPNLFDRLYPEPEGPQPAAVEPRSTDQQPELASELAAIREENERLGGKLESLQHDHAEIQSERNSLLAQLEELRGDKDRLQTEHEQGRQELQLLRDELASVHLDERLQGVQGERDQLAAQLRVVQAELGNQEALAISSTSILPNRPRPRMPRSARRRACRAAPSA